MCEEGQAGFLREMIIFCLIVKLDCPVNVFTGAAVRKHRVVIAAAVAFWCAPESLIPSPIYIAVPTEYIHSHTKLPQPTVLRRCMSGVYTVLLRCASYNTLILKDLRDHRKGSVRTPFPVSLRPPICTTHGPTACCETWQMQMARPGEPALLRVLCVRPPPTQATAKG